MTATEATSAGTAAAATDPEEAARALRVRAVIRHMPRICGALGVAGGALVLVGWWLELPQLTSIAPGLPPMVANTALMAVLLGASLILAAPGRSSRGRAIAGKVCAGAVAVIAAVTLAEYLFRADLRLDDILISTGATLIGHQPDRPTPQSAAACLLMAAALLIVEPRSGRGRGLSRILALAAILIPVLAILGHLFGVAALHQPTSLLPYTGMALHTAVVLLALGAGIAVVGIDGGMLSILMKEDSGGTAARHLATGLLAFAPVVCAIAIGARLGLYAAPFASALVVLAGAVGGTAFMLRVSSRLSRLDEKRRETEGILRQWHERFELALRGADLGVWDWNLESGEVIFSPRWAEMRGFRLDELAPHVDTWISGVHPEDLPQVRKVLDDYLEGRVAEYEVEHRVRTRSGQWIWILDRGKVCARDAGGRPTRMAGTELDITARKQLEEERAFLAEVGTILASTLELDATLASIGRLVTRALADVCIVYVTGAGHEIRRIGAAARDPSLDGVRDFLMQRPMDRRKAAAIWAEMDACRSILLERMPPDMIDAYAQDEEHARALRAMDMRSAIMVPLAAHGRQVGAMSLIASGSSRTYTPADVRFAEQIAQRAALAIENARLYDEARRAIKSRDDVLGVVAHDLRNPLGSILLQAEMLRSSGGEPGSRPHERAEGIARSARRMNRLIQDLLDVTRMEAGSLSIDRARIAAGEVLGECAEAQRPLAVAASLELRLEVAPDLPDVWADRDRLQQVFENLIGNAIKFTGPGGAITVGAAPRDGEVLCRVADTGAGISAEDLPHVFDRFWQAQRPGRHGAGLGLAIAKGIVEAHGGRIWVESTPGRGSSFFFTMPTAPRAEARSTSPAAHAP
ncbi:MAG TPA: ATP-binding protein [Kofleriaceae bacterium]|nr:ATP-binding protein [Kofleriaceae bacterium]